MAKMSKQKIFETVAKHLINQNCKSLTENRENCAYRGVNDTKCAVGCLIPDRCYDSKMERNTVDRIKLPYAIKDNIELLIDLQQIHDNDYPHNWRNRLIRLGKSLKLDTSFIEHL